MRKIIGAAMIATPFVAMTALMVAEGGGVWAFVIIVVALVVGGLALLNPNMPIRLTPTGTKSR
jgi:hypothetical protein